MKRIPTSAMSRAGIPSSTSDALYRATSVGLAPSPVLTVIAACAACVMPVSRGRTDGHMKSWADHTKQSTVRLTARGRHSERKTLRNTRQWPTPSSWAASTRLSGTVRP